MIASVSSEERDSRERVRLRASFTSQGATSGRVTRRKPPPTSMIWSALPCPGSPPPRPPTSSARLAGGRQVEHLPDALGLDRSLGGEEQSFDDVDWLSHARSLQGLGRRCAG